VFSGEAARPVVLDDAHDTWGHNVFRWDRNWACSRRSSVRLVAHGPVKSCDSCDERVRGSKLVQDFALYPDLDQIEVSVNLDWRESPSCSSSAFRYNVKFEGSRTRFLTVTSNVFANATKNRLKAGWIFPAHRATPISPTALACSRGKNSLDVNVHDIGFTVLRSPAYANHIPSVLEPNGFYSFMIRHSTFQLYSVAAPRQWETADTSAACGRVEPAAYRTHRDVSPAGDTPAARLVSSAIEPANMVVSAVKQAEDNDDLILRATRRAQSATRATVRCQMGANY